MVLILLSAETATVLAITTSVLSLIGSLVIVILGVRFPDFRNNFFRKLVFVLSIYDALLSFLFIIPGSSGSGFCVFQGYALVWLAAMPPYFSLCIAVITYIHISKNWGVERLQKLMTKLHIISNILCLILTILSISLADSHKFPNSHWCFIEGRAILGVWYSFIWICTIVSCVLYVLIIHYIRKIYKTVQELTNIKDIKKQKENLKVQLRMSTIPLSLILTWTIASIRRAREIFSPDSEQNSTLNILHSLTNPMQGFYDCIVFVILSSYSRRRVKQLLRCEQPGSSEATSLETDSQL
ncbi:g protein-coupled receptor [Anaeramoeba flamelloides]|uniref:G protein-coupled receptor n=1 Tax=Anaeramoeba flamelloides TaxID=1746091 RepID=A0ABQ8Y3T5_9EUKA|nr:g protein-coupled receptor [Anaeramoeba flamelloides]